MPPSSTIPCSTHKTKRQNCSITTFLPATPSTTIAPLPAPIQASLQTVGMRVRKSIASGYKTKTTSFPALIFPSNTYSDLTPPSTFPGVSKDDQFASQPRSQESVPGNGLKRGHDEVDDDDGDEVVEGEEAECGKVEVEQQQQRSAFDLLMTNRHVAIPKSQKKRDSRRRGWHKAVERKGGVGRGAVGAGWLGVKEVGDEGGEDFGDAGFLRPVGEVEMDVDV
ncbi:hypothetical protein L211DRAFT_279542 [Terfezia boudieri ATCC MYA-4762]|uniref:Uncharacterized protein n=1 Tax=Terfezia boudieri ATCC MYA-4762 TaxID=1051890 RepID=A0A3N4LJX5_9PEZI|nr:hypothetical protein L211DRAFT_279542 [Terfezia boudieri ATCC MYA-4762]